MAFCFFVFGTRFVTKKCKFDSIIVRFWFEFVNRSSGLMDTYCSAQVHCYLALFLYFVRPSTITKAELLIG